MSEEIEKISYCKRCGRQVTEEPLKVSDDVVKEYMRCRLGGRLFSREFKSLDGSLIITLETANASISRLLEKYLDPDGILANSDAQVLALVSSIDRVDRDNGTINNIYKADAKDRKNALSDIDTGMDAICDALDVVELGLVRRATKAFVILNNVLMETAIDENFYKGVGLL